MATKNIRDIVVKVSGKDLTTAARDSEKLNKNLEAVISTVKGAGRGFKSINTALESMAQSMKAVNSSMSASKIKTKGLENYQARMKELNKTLVSVKNTAENTSKALKSVNRSTGNNTGTSELVAKLNQVVIGLDRIEERIRVSNIQLRAMEENTGKTAKRLKATRDATSSTSRAMSDFSKNTQKATKSADAYNNAARGMAGGGRNQARAFSELAFSMNPLTSLYASIAINVYALTEAFRLLSEAANFSRLLDQTAKFSASVSGINVKGLARDMADLSEGALSVRESMQFAIKGAAFNFTAEQLENLTVGARKASIALGRDFNDSMDRVLRGISKQEIELFDELGVVTRLTPAFQKYASQIGKTVDELSDYERQLALTNEVQGQLDEKFNGIDITATAWEELGIAAKNALDGVLIGLQDTLKPLAESATSLFKLVSSSTEVSKATKDLAESQKIYNSALSEGKTGQALIAYGQMIEASKKLEGVTLTVSEAVEKTEERVGTLSDAIIVLGTATAAYALRGPATAMATALKIVSSTALNAGKSVYTTFIALRAIGMGGAASAIVSGISLISTGFIALSKAVKLATLALLKNPITWVIIGGLAAGFYLFREEVENLADSFIGLIPGLDNTKQAMEGIKTAASSSDVTFQKMSKTLSEMGVSVAGKSKEEIIEMGAALKGFATSADESIANISGLVASSQRLEGPLSDVLDQLVGLRDANVAESIKDVSEVTARLRKEFAETAKELGTNTSMFETFDELYASVLRTNNLIKDMSFNINSMGKDVQLFGGKESAQIVNEIAYNQDLINRLTAEGSVLNRKQIEELKQKVILLEKDLVLKKSEERLAQITAKNSRDTMLWEARRLGTFTEKYEVMQKELTAQEKINAHMQVAVGYSSIEKANQAALVQSLQIQVGYYERIAKLQAKSRSAQADESVMSNLFQGQRANEQLGGRRLNEQTEASRNTTMAGLREASAKAEFDLAKAEGAPREELRTLGSNLDLAAEEKRIAIIKEQAAGYREVASAIREVSGSVPGLSSLQSQFIDMSQTISSTMANVTELVANNQELTLSDFSDSIIAIGSMASSMFSELTKGVVSDIDAQIAAEKKRDGKSQESLAKIQALEKKKIKEQEKSKIAQTAMSTSLAIMKTMAEVPWPANIAMSAGIGAMGMMQINNIKKASAGQMAALESSGASGLSVSVGSRNNAVDVSQAASMGELSYLRGEGGMGSGANNFTPGRAGGGSVTVGERGPETIRPTQPLYVEPTSSSSDSDSKPSVINQNNLQVTAMDAQSIIDRSDDIWESLEKAANSRGFTLQSLN